MSESLNFNKKSFVSYLKAISKVSDIAVTKVGDDVLLNLLANSENTLYLVGEYFGIDGGHTLNCPSLKKLSNLVSMIPSDEIELTVNHNNLEYRGNGVKFKYHLYEDGLISTPKMTLEKVKNFEYDVEFEINSDLFSRILKMSSKVEADKLYLYTDDDHLHWDVKDDTKPNTDSVAFTPPKEVDFELEKFIFSLNNLKLMSFSNDVLIKFRFNTKLGIGSMKSENDGYTIEYISPSLSK